jgi:membrane associated rhomboid family serine protease
LGEIVRHAPVSAAIIAINVVVFVLAERAGDTTSNDTLLHFGAVWRGMVWDGEYWRLATAMFLHIGVLHLVWNAWMGFRFSAEAEQQLVSGIAGSAASVIGHNAVAAGASGALFGLIGWRLADLRSRHGSFKAFISEPGIRSELKSIAIWFVVGVVAGFDNYAHGGGLVFGALFGWMLAAPPARNRARLAVTAAAEIVLVTLSLRPLPLLHPYEAASLKVERALDLQQYADALAAADSLVAAYPRESYAYALRGYAREQLNDLQGAEADYENAVNIDNDPWARDALEALRAQEQESD